MKNVGAILIARTSKKSLKNYIGEFFMVNPESYTLVELRQLAKKEKGIKNVSKLKKRRVNRIFNKYSRRNCIAVRRRSVYRNT